MIDALFDRCNNVIEKHNKSKIEAFQSRVSDYIKLIKSFIEEITEEELDELAEHNAIIVDNNERRIKFNLGSVDNHILNGKFSFSKRIIKQSCDLRDEYEKINRFTKNNRSDNRFLIGCDWSRIVVEIKDVGTVRFYFEDNVLEIVKSVD